MHKQRTSGEGSFGQLVGSYRTLRTNLSQKALARLLGLSETAFRNWETDQSRPEAKNLQRLFEVFLEQGIFTPRKEIEEARALWNASKVNVVFDEVWLNALTNIRKQKQIESAPSLVDTSTQGEENPSPEEVLDEDIIGLEEGGPMKKDRRDLTIALTGGSLWIAGMGPQDLITEVQRVLRQPSLGLSDKELKFLEQKIMIHWQARNNVVLAPTDLILHVDQYVQEVKTLLDRSLFPSIRMRLCACLSQGMLLRGVCFYDLGQFQTARTCYQTALEAASEADNNILQALGWYWNAFSWMRSNEPDRYNHALDSMLKACRFASLESDLAVQGITLAGSAEAHAYLKEKTACLEALDSAERLVGFGSGTWSFMYVGFNLTRVNGYRGICLQQFSQSDLLEEARQALEEALSQHLNVAPLKRAFYVVDMAQLCARKGEVESACDHAKQIITFAGTSASLRKKLAMVCTLLEPFADVQLVKDLDREIRVVLLGQ